MKWYVDKNTHELLDETQIDKHFKKNYMVGYGVFRELKEDVYEEVIRVESEDLDE